MEDQKNTLVVKPSFVQHQIDVDDENRKFEHDNTYKSCCLTIDKRALNFFTQAIFSGAVVGFCITMLSTNTDCDTYSRYASLLTFIVGVWVPNPRMKD